MSQTSHGQESHQGNKIRVFAVDATPLVLEALADLLTMAPERDLVYVGGAQRNTSDLPERVRQAQADVVLVDLILVSELTPHEARRNPEAGLMQRDLGHLTHLGPFLFQFLRGDKSLPSLGLNRFAKRVLAPRHNLLSANPF